MRTKGLWVAICVCMSLVGTLGLQAEGEVEESLAMDALPDAVQKTFREHRQGVEPDAVEREDSKGFIFYEAEYQDGEVKHEIKVDEQGRIVAIEEEMPLSHLPKEALESVHAAYPGAEIEEVELKTLIHYEIAVEFGKDDEERKVKILENGYLLASGSEEEEEEDESEITWDQMPEAVRAAITAHREGVQPSEFEQMTVNGHVLYEAEYDEEDGVKREIKIDETGQIIEVEEELPISKSPPALLEKVKSLFPNASIEEIELKRSTYYVVEVEKGDEETEVKILANGLILGVEEED